MDSECVMHALRLQAMHCHVATYCAAMKPCAVRTWCRCQHASKARIVCKGLTASVPAGVRQLVGDIGRHVGVGRDVGNLCGRETIICSE